MSDSGANIKKFKTKEELQQHYIQQAKQTSHQQHGSDPSSLFASCQQLAAAHGVGIGMYFKSLIWLKWMFLLLTLAAVPYWVVINTSVFTDFAHKNDHEFGVKVYDGVQLFSFSLAAIVDNSNDNGTLQYMNTEIANEWKGPMTKGNFLTWISIVDAGAIVLAMALVTYITMQSTKFVRSVDADVLEAADYSVIVHGLPHDTDVQEIGMYFSRFGEVMDVVLVKDMGGVLEACAEASALEQKRALMADQMRLYNSVRYQRRAERIEGKLEKMLTRIELGLSKRQYPLKVAFVTFNYEAERRVCQENCPSSWFGSWFMQRVDCFRGTRPFWVTRACPPEDYIFENLSVPMSMRLLRRGFTRAVVFAILIVCAASITKLSTLSMQEAGSLSWLKGDMASAVASSAARLFGLGSAVQQPLRYLASTATTPASNQTSYCAEVLPAHCQPHFSGLYGTNVQMDYGQVMQWSNWTDRLLKQRPLLHSMAQCADPSSPSCSVNASASNATVAAAALPSCLPCYCQGLASNEQLEDQEWIAAAKAACGSLYIDAWDLRSWGIKISISLVIAALNACLKLVLEYLLLLEKHWTHSAQERSYAVAAFLSQLLNTAVVLLLVNASALRDATHSGASRFGWLRYIIMDGSFSDFSPSWYEDVGLSILVLLMINVLTPLLTLAADVSYKAAQRCWLLKCTEAASQWKFDQAFARPEFNLQQRVADAMLNVAIALTFGSGMPLCYLIVFIGFGVAAFVERYALTRVCHVPARYRQQLPNLITALLPWAAIVHCAFGVWMHTYFQVEKNDIITSTLTGSTSDAASFTPATSTAESLQERRLWSRIVQPNGLPLTLTCACILAWFAVRFVVWPVIHALMRRGRRPYMRQEEGNCCCCWCFPGVRRLYGRMLSAWEEPPPNPTSYEDALTSRQLRGTFTYRLPHQPRYAAAFSGKLYKAIWVRAVGRSRFTRLLSGTAGDFRVSPELLVEADMSDLEEALGRLPQKLSELVQRMATTETQPPSTRKGSRATSVHSPPLSKATGKFSLVGTPPASVIRSKAAVGSATGQQSLTAPGVMQSPERRQVHISVLADNPPPGTLPVHMMMLAAGDSSSGAAAPGAASSSGGNHATSAAVTPLRSAAVIGSSGESQQQHAAAAAAAATPATATMITPQRASNASHALLLTTTQEFFELDPDRRVALLHEMITAAAAAASSTPPQQQLASSSRDAYPTILAATGFPGSTQPYASQPAGTAVAISSPLALTSGAAQSAAPASAAPNAAEIAHPGVQPASSPYPAIGPASAGARHVAWEQPCMLMPFAMPPPAVLAGAGGGPAAATTEGGSSTAGASIGASTDGGAAAGHAHAEVPTAAAAYPAIVSIGSLMSLRPLVSSELASVGDSRSSATQPTVSE